VQLLVLALGASLPLVALEAWRSRERVAGERRSTEARLQGIARLAAGRADERLRVTVALTVGVESALRDARTITAMRTILQRGLAESPVPLSDLTVIDTLGRFVVSARWPAGAALASAADREWFRRARASPTPIVSLPYQTRGDAGARQWVVTTARRLHDASGQVIGVLSAPTELAALTDLTRIPALPEDASVTIVDTSGVVLTRAPDAVAWAGRDIGPLEAFQVARRLRFGAWEGTAADSVRRLGGFATAAFAPWLVVVSLPSATVAAGRAEAVWADAGRVVLASVLALALALLLGDQFVRPVERLTREAQRLADGEPPRAAAAIPRSELGVLTTAFDHMAREMASRTAALADSEQRYRLLFDGMPAPMWAWVADSGVIVAVNEAAVQHYGYTRAQLVGMPVEELLAPEERPRLAERRATVGLPTAPRAAGTWWHVTADGRRVETEIVATPMQLAGRLCILNVGFDVTERRAAERALAQSEAQLRQSQKMEAVGQLAGGVAHDFNNLLTGILGHCELLLGQPGIDGRVRADVSEIQQTARRAAELTRQILVFSRKQVVQPTVVDPAEVVRELERLLHRVLGEDLDLVVDAAPGVGLIRIGRGQLEQVLVNLATNARDAMGAGGRLTIRVEPVSDGGAHAVGVVVQDTGQGMGAALRERIFEPFFTTKPRGQGTGLGLTMVYGIVREAGGSIVVESVEGAGTTFRLLFPAVASEGDGVSMAKGSAALPAGRGEHVLLVEDDAAVRRVAEALLRRHGYVVTVAEDGAQALELLTTGTLAIDLLLTDVVMPRMNGRELVERARDKRPDLRVLFASGYTDDDMLRRGVAADRVDLLEKPFTAAELLARVRRALDG
jgi:PAS domain S-box-containing protein